jgi:hypothetical protein
MFLARVDADQIGHDAERRQRDDVDLGMSEEPEQVLEQDRTAAVVSELLALVDERRHEEARAERLVQDHHDRAHEERRKRKQREDRRHEDPPHGEREPHQRHPPRARLQHRHDIVQAAHREADDEEREGNEHQDDPQLAPGVPSRIACGG